MGEILYASRNNGIDLFRCCLQYLNYYKGRPVLFVARHLPSFVRVLRQTIKTKIVTSGSIFQLVSFFDTSFESKRLSSSICISGFILEMSFCTMASSLSSLPCVTSKLLVISQTSLDILSRCSLVFCNQDFTISLSFILMFLKFFFN